MRKLSCQELGSERREGPFISQMEGNVSEKIQTANEIHKGKQDGSQARLRNDSQYEE